MALDRPSSAVPSRRRTALRVLAYVAAWLVGAAAATAVLFFTGTGTVEVASHEAVMQPNLSGSAVLQTGPVLPDVRLDTGDRIGVDIRLEKTDATSIDELVRRYGYIAGQPEGQVAAVRSALGEMFLDAALRGAIIGLIPLAVWALVGRRRRRELCARIGPTQVLIAAGLVVLLGVALWQPWTDRPRDPDDSAWVSLAQFLGPDVPVPAELAGVEVRGDVLTAQTNRLIESAIETYNKSKSFYARAAEAAADLDLRVPEEGDTVVAFVSDRHDNIGMDHVARAVADAAGATAVFNGGDDTSTGKSWEAFSLDSVSKAFEGLARWGVAGNHDHGSFVREHLTERGWTMLDGEIVEGPGGSTLLGLDDPRSSGLGSWRDESGLSFAEVAERLADVACEADEPVSTMLVHDANLGRAALERGCVDLVIGGHLHVRVGPTAVVGENGETGWSYTNGTTGGAAYAIAVGSKPRRDAMVSLITYRDGRPLGLQWVTVQTNGVFEVGPWTPLGQE